MVDFLHKLCDLLLKSHSIAKLLRIRGREDKDITICRNFIVF